MTATSTAACAYKGCPPRHSDRRNTNTVNTAWRVHPSPEPAVRSTQRTAFLASSCALNAAAVQPRPLLGISTVQGTEFVYYGHNRAYWTFKLGLLVQALTNSAQRSPRPAYRCQSVKQPGKGGGCREWRGVGVEEGTAVASALDVCCERVQRPGPATPPCSAENRLAATALTHRAKCSFPWNVSSKGQVWPPSQLHRITCCPVMQLAPYCAQQ